MEGGWRVGVSMFSARSFPGQPDGWLRVLVGGLPWAAGWVVASRAFPVGGGGLPEVGALSANLPAWCQDPWERLGGF